MNKQLLRFILGLALFTLACQSFNVEGLDLPGFNPTQTENTPPTSRFIEAQTVNLSQNQGTQAVFVSNMAALGAYQTQIPLVYFFSRSQMVRPKTPQSVLAEDVIRATVDKPLAVGTYHVDPEKLDSIDIFINNQPVNVEQPNTFPSSLMEVQICSDYAWSVVNQTLTPLCTETGLVKTNRVSTDIFSTNAKRVTLIITPHVAGTYQLTMVANDAHGSSSRLTRQIVVVSQTP